MVSNYEVLLVLIFGCLIFRVFKEIRWFAKWKWFQRKLVYRQKRALPRKRPISWLLVSPSQPLSYLWNGIVEANEQCDFGHGTDRIRKTSFFNYEYACWLLNDGTVRCSSGDAILHRPDLLPNVHFIDMAIMDTSFIYTVCLLDEQGFVHCVGDGGSEDVGQPIDGGYAALVGDADGGL